MNILAANQKNRRNGVIMVGLAIALFVSLLLLGISSAYYQKRMAEKDDLIAIAVENYNSVTASLDEHTEELIDAKQYMSNILDITSTPTGEITEKTFNPPVEVVDKLSTFSNPPIFSDSEESTAGEISDCLKYETKYRNYKKAYKKEQDLVKALLKDVDSLANVTTKQRKTIDSLSNIPTRLVEVSPLPYKKTLQDESIKVQVKVSGDEVELVSWYINGDALGAKVTVLTSPKKFSILGGKSIITGYTLSFDNPHVLGSDVPALPINLLLNMRLPYYQSSGYSKKEMSRKGNFIEEIGIVGYIGVGFNTTFNKEDYNNPYNSGAPWQWFQHGWGWNAGIGLKLFEFKPFAKPAKLARY